MPTMTHRMVHWVCSCRSKGCLPKQKEIDSRIRHSTTLGSSRTIWSRLAQEAGIAVQIHQLWKKVQRIILSLAHQKSIWRSHKMHRWARITILSCRRKTWSREGRVWLRWLKVRMLKHPSNLWTQRSSKRSLARSYKLNPWKRKQTLLLSICPQT